MDPDRHETYGAKAGPRHRDAAGGRAAVDEGGSAWRARSAKAVTRSRGSGRINPDPSGWARATLLRGSRAVRRAFAPGMPGAPPPGPPRSSARSAPD